MMVTVFPLIWFLHFAALAAEGPDTSFKAKRVAYLSFGSETDTPVSRKIIFENYSRTRQLSANTARGLCLSVLSSREHGHFDNAVVRFAIVFESGHNLAIDQEGGVLLDGYQFVMSRKAFAAVVEMLARSYSE